MLNSLKSSDILKSECGRSIEPLTSLLVTRRCRYSQARGPSTHTKKMIISHQTLRYSVETKDNNHKITFCNNNYKTTKFYVVIVIHYFNFL